MIPITHGRDFVVWDKASAATLWGVNIYAHHPDYPGGPFTYSPLFLYLELPFRWLAAHSAIPFTVLGKVPILVADIGCGALIAGELRHRGFGGRTVAWATALFFLNPLVIYNSAYYGRFDTVCVALLLLAFRGMRRPGVVSRPTALYYALDRGYFTKQGVKVSMQTPSDPSAGLKLVATNKFDLAVYYEGDMFYAGQSGLPVIAVGALIPTPLNSMIVKPGSKIKALKDLKGVTSRS